MRRLKKGMALSMNRVLATVVLVIDCRKDMPAAASMIPASSPGRPMPRTRAGAARP